MAFSDILQKKVRDELRIGAFQNIFCKRLRTVRFDPLYGDIKIATCTLAFLKPTPDLLVELCLQSRRHVNDPIRVYQTAIIFEGVNVVRCLLAELEPFAGIAKPVPKLVSDAEEGRGGAYFGSLAEVQYNVRIQRSPNPLRVVESAKYGLT